MNALARNRPPRPPVHRVTLAIPPFLPAALGCDAVGVPVRQAYQLMGRLPRVGCVFADTDHWWWIVPAGSDLEIVWPAPARYAVGAAVPVTGPRDTAERPPGPWLVHWPDDSTPYTPPIPLYLMVCQLTGAEPAWSGDTPTGSLDSGSAPLPGRCG